MMEHYQDILQTLRTLGSQVWAGSCMWDWFPTQWYLNLIPEFYFSFFSDEHEIPKPEGIENFRKTYFAELFLLK